jgi:hypothetical protein
MASPLGGAIGDPGASTINVKHIDDGPLGGVVGDPGAPTINAKNVNGRTPRRHYRRSGSTHHQRKKMSMADPRAPGPPWGSSLQSGSGRCVINLHGYDRQKVILLTGPTSLRLVLLCPTILGRFMGMGNSVRRYLGYAYGFVQRHVSSGPPVLSYRR